MKTFVILLGLLMTSCSSVNQYDYDSSKKSTFKERQVKDFNDIPADFLNQFNRMGVDSSSILNYYEAQYLSFIFGVDTSDINLFGAKVGFLGSKILFFAAEKDRFYRGVNSGVGGSGLYIFNSSQKQESGGYDAVVTYWSKIAIPIEDVVIRMKSNGM
ncbi:MAG: hypothetical protein II951_05055 [Bacteroidales bacterium]|nr:hypothetical protein [Bacteroidales bacterium]